MIETNWFENGARVAHALAHPLRLSILEMLRDEGAYVMHLTTMLGRPQSNISQHLAILRDAGLVADAREGMTVVYRVRDPRIFDVVDQMKALASESNQCRCRGAGRHCRNRDEHRHECHCPHCTGRH